MTTPPTPTPNANIRSTPNPSPISNPLDRIPINVILHIDLRNSNALDPGDLHRIRAKLQDDMAKGRAVLAHADALIAKCSVEELVELQQGRAGVYLRM